MTPAIESVDVCDICQAVDRVAIFPGAPGTEQYRALPFAIDDDCPDVLTQLDVDLRQYPAVVEVVKRAVDIPRQQIRFEPLPAVRDRTGA